MHSYLRHHYCRFYDKKGNVIARTMKAYLSLSQGGHRLSAAVEALAEEKMMKHLVLVCQEATPRKVGAILILPWQKFLERLWSDAFVG